MVAGTRSSGQLSYLSHTLSLKPHLLPCAQGVCAGQYQEWGEGHYGGY